MKLFCLAFYYAVGVIAFGGWLLPNLMNAKSTELNLLGVALVPLALVAAYRIGRYIWREFEKKFNKEESGNA